MKKILIVIDMQNDFIDGALGTAEAQSIVPAVIDKIKLYDKDNVFATRDTHHDDYLNTQEGKMLPVPHCIMQSTGWAIREEIGVLISEKNIFDKPTFGSISLVEKIKQLGPDIAIEIIGVCTDICVVSNALLIKAALPEVEITVDSSCCAGVTPEKHKAALETMQSCQIKII